MQDICQVLCQEDSSLCDPTCTDFYDQGGPVLQQEETAFDGKEDSEGRCGCAGEADLHLCKERQLPQPRKCEVNYLSL